MAPQPNALMAFVLGALMSAGLFVTLNGGMPGKHVCIPVTGKHDAEIAAPTPSQRGSSFEFALQQQVQRLFDRQDEQQRLITNIVRDGAKQAAPPSPTAASAPSPAQTHCFDTRSRIPPSIEICKKADVSAHGGWCLAANMGAPFLAPGRPLAHHHVVADAGVAKTVAEVIGRDQTMLDIGAGIGQYGVWFMNNNVTFARYMAFDGATNAEAFTFGVVRYLNLAYRVDWLPHEVSDWVMSLEVAEHVDKAYEDILVDNLHRANRKGLILSWARPGQGGHSHINERPNEYVIEKMAGLGYAYDEKMSKLGRSRASYYWFKNTFMVFRRKEPIQAEQQ